MKNMSEEKPKENVEALKPRIAEVVVVKILWTFLPCHKLGIGRLELG